VQYLAHSYLPPLSSVRVSLSGSRNRSATVAAIALSALLCAVVASATADPEPTSYYVSLGDSLARGVQPGSDGRSQETNQGYVDFVARGLARSHPGVRSVKLGCSGETTASMLSGGHCTYRGGSELAAAERFLRGHRGHVAAVTVNIGDNDVEQCMTNSRIDEKCVSTQLAGIRSRLPGIASRLRAAAGAGVPVVGLTDYDQFLAYWLEGAAGQRMARRSVQVVDELNSTMNAIYQKAGVLAADATGPFATNDLSHQVALKGHGQVPLAVQRICTWTWACSAPPIGFNDHANATGYRVLGGVVLTALRTR
jgi:lysophospholipase L1-like esterase